jgi:hypothetical protein
MPLGLRLERFADVGQLLSTAIVFLTYHALFALFHRYDWGQPFVKLACFETMFLAVAVLPRQRAWSGEREALAVASFELIAACGILAWEVLRAAHLFRVGLHVDMNDIGGTTDQAARMLFIGHLNPYREPIAAIGNDPAYFGYKYGPMMIIAYALAGVLPNGAGVKITNAIYLAVIVATVTYVASRVPDDGDQRNKRGMPAAGALAAAMVLLPERLYYEAFNQGAPDVLPSMLVLLSVAFVARRQWLGAGLCAGLSFSVKFSPATFLIVLFVRRRVPRRLVLGLCLGLLPFVPFLLWDAPALGRNVFLFHSFKSYDSTSLYSVTPSELHRLFPLFQALAVAVAVFAGFRRAIEPRLLMVTFTLLLVCIEVSYREIHGNHLVWFVGPTAICFAWGRHGLPRVLSAQGLWRRR